MTQKRLMDVERPGKRRRRRRRRRLLTFKIDGRVVEQIFSFIGEKLTQRCEPLFALGFPPNKRRLQCTTIDYSRPRKLGPDLIKIFLKVPRPGCEPGIF